MKEKRGAGIYYLYNPLETRSTLANTQTPRASSRRSSQGVKAAANLVFESVSNQRVSSSSRNTLKESRKTVSPSPSKRLGTRQVKDEKVWRPTNYPLPKPGSGGNKKSSKK